MLLSTVLLFSTLFVSASLGHIIATYLKWKAKEWQMFIVGFVILNPKLRLKIRAHIPILQVFSYLTDMKAIAPKDLYICNP